MFVEDLFSSHSGIEQKPAALTQWALFLAAEQSENGLTDGWMSTGFAEMEYVEIVLIRGRLTTRRYDDTESGTGK